MEHMMESHVYYSIPFGGKDIPFITDITVNMWVVTAIIMVAVFLMTRKMEMVPKKAQNLAEIMVDAINGMSKNQIGHHWKTFAPYLGTVLLFLAVSNTLGLFNIIPSGETLAVWFKNPSLKSFSFPLHPPTKSLSVTLMLALLSIFIVIWAEFRFKGVKGWVKSFYKPTPVLAFVKLLDYVVRPLSLCLRLFGNILGGYIVITLMYMAIPVFAPVIGGIYFDIFDGLLQAYVFVFLTMIYISEAVEEVEEN